MKLRTRLMLGYGYLVSLVLVVAASSTLGFFQLSRGIRGVLEENFASVRAAIDMQQALERQDSILLQTLNRRTPSASLEEHDRSFRKALDRAARNITIAGEQEVVDAIRDSYEAFVERRQRLLAGSPPSMERYDRDVYPAFVGAKDAVLRLMELNYGAMISADEAALGRAARFGLWIGVIVIVALASLIFIARGLQEYVVDRLREMSQTARAVGSGESHRRFFVAHEDELGDVAVLLNETLDRADEFRNRSSSVQSEGRKLGAALFETLAESPAVLLDAGDNVVARVGPADDVDRLLEARDTDEVRQTPLMFGGRPVGRVLRQVSTKPA